MNERQGRCVLQFDDVTDRLLRLRDQGESE